MFAAFSQDNIPIATNYRLHTSAVDYTVDDHLGLNLTWYRYRPLRSALFDGPDGWRNRVRLNALLSF